MDANHGTRTIVCCQATRNVSSFYAARLGDDGWDQAAGTASLEWLHARKPDRVLISHDGDDCAAIDQLENAELTPPAGACVSPVGR